MRKRLASLSATVVALVAFGSPPAWAADETLLSDAIGAEIPVGLQATKVITLAPSLGELVAAIDGEAPGRLVGVSEYTDFPSALKKVASIGPYNRFNLESVVALKPDLVLATRDGNAEDQIRHLKELGLRVVVVDTTSLELVGRSIRQIGLALGRVKDAQRLAKSFEDGLDAARKRAKGRPVRKVLLQLGDEPLIVAGGNAFLSGALETIGAANAYRESNAHYPRPSTEDAATRNPDAIVILAMGDLAPFEKMAVRWRSFPKLKAVKTGRVRVLKADTLLRPTLRLLDGLKLLEEAVYGS